MTGRTRTIRVAEVLHAANTMLAAPDGTRAGRQAVTVLLETVLMKTGNYAGFRYLGDWNVDDSRREYYARAGLARVVR